jgi:hypothetical protein
MRILGIINSKGPDFFLPAPGLYPGTSVFWHAYLHINYLYFMGMAHPNTKFNPVIYKTYQIFSGAFGPLTHKPTHLGFGISAQNWKS